MSVGSYHACAISHSNELRCWGRSDSGQTKLPYMFKGKVTQISAGHSHTCIMHQRRFFCFGSNTQGQNDIPPIVKNNSFQNPFSHIEAGNNFTCAIFGYQMKLQCWGDTRNQVNLVPQDQEKNMREVYAGSAHVCALRNVLQLRHSPKAIQCWGLNYYGQSDVPDAIEGGRRFNLSAGVQHNCAIMDYVMVCWGLDADGQASRQPKFNKESEIQSLNAGYLMTCMVVKQKEVCWGETNLLKGQKKQKNKRGDWEKFKIQGMGLGMYNVCAKDQVGDLVCQGGNEYGQCDIPKVS